MLQGRPESLGHDEVVQGPCWQVGLVVASDLLSALAASWAQPWVVDQLLAGDRLLAVVEPLVPGPRLSGRLLRQVERVVFPPEDRSPRRQIRHEVGLQAPVGSQVDSEVVAEVEESGSSV